MNLQAARTWKHSKGRWHLLGPVLVNGGHRAACGNTDLQDRDTQRNMHVGADTVPEGSRCHACQGWPGEAPQDDDGFTALVARWQAPRTRTTSARAGHIDGLTHESEIAYHRHVTLEATRRGIPERDLAYQLEWEQALIAAGFEPRTEAAA